VDLTPQSSGGRGTLAGATRGRTGPIWVDVSGPEGTKAFLGNLLHKQ
jgi:hypothetical protein